MPFAPKGPRLVVCEGKTDRKMFDKLFAARNLRGFESASPNQETNLGGGWTQFGRYLNALSVPESFRKSVKLVIVAADNDDANSFANTCDQVEQAGYTRPANPRRIVKTDGKPDLAILMIPDTPPGCLETLCYSAACEKWPEIQQPLETYIAQSAAGTWGAVKKAKALVECVLASTCAPKPEIALHDHWQQPDQFHIPVTGAAFDSVADFLRSESVASYAEQ